jgi:hypothetical protein
MYDYLAKVILLGPSGSGKLVRSPSLHLVGRTTNMSIWQIMPLAPVCEV